MFSVPVIGAALLLHVKKHGKKDALHSNTKSDQGKCSRNKNGFQLKEFEIETVDSQYK
jgi:hypothetical protein